MSTTILYFLSWMLPYSRSPWKVLRFVLSPIFAKCLVWLDTPDAPTRYADFEAVWVDPTGDSQGGCLYPPSLASPSKRKFCSFFLWKAKRGIFTLYLVGPAQKRNWPGCLYTLRLTRFAPSWYFFIFGTISWAQMCPFSIYCSLSVFRVLLL